MEKSRILHPLSYALILAVLCLTGACSLPRFIVLHDALSPEEHISLGVAYEKKGDLEGALKEYGVASARLPVAYLYMGNVHFAKKEYDLAGKRYRQAIAGSGDPRAYNNLAWLHYTLDADLKEAQELAETAVGLSPDSAEFRDTLDKIRKRRGQDRKAGPTNNGRGESGQ